MTLRFSDGMEFDLSGELRIERRSDGLYVVGAGMLIPIGSRAEGVQFIKDHNERRTSDDRETVKSGRS